MFPQGRAFSAALLLYFMSECSLTFFILMLKRLAGFIAVIVYVVYFQIILVSEIFRCFQYREQNLSSFFFFFLRATLH